MEPMHEPRISDPATGEDLSVDMFVYDKSTGLPSHSIDH